MLFRSELIADLIEETGEARVVDLAQRLGVSNATVNNTIQRLQRDGLVTSKPYRSIFLTEEGEAMATIVSSMPAIIFRVPLLLRPLPERACSSSVLCAQPTSRCSTQ